MKKKALIFSFILIFSSTFVSDIYNISAANESGQCISCEVQEGGYFLCKTGRDEGGFECTVSGDGQQCTETKPCKK